MRISVGLKIGGGFFLLTVILVIAGIVGYTGALTLGKSIDNIGSNALRASQGSSEFSIAIQKQTATTQTIVQAIKSANPESLAQINEEQITTSNALNEMKQSGLVNISETDAVERFYQAYLQSQSDLLAAHSDYIDARQNAFKGFNDFEEYMKVLEFYTNQIYNLPSIDQGDKLELTSEFYQSKVALQLRFYYVQRYLGGDKEMLDSLEAAEDDLTDEAEELSELDLLDNIIRTGRYENQNYIEVLEELVEQHTSQFEDVVSKYQKFKEVQVAYSVAENETLTSTETIVESINKLVAEETFDASATSENVNKTILVAICIGVILAILATLLSVSRVVNPIKRLALMASRIAKGDLDAEIKSKTQDEIGDLANNFDSMRVQIRKKLMDLQELNRAGETIVSAVDQNEALQKSLETMFHKTKVEQASVYLLNSEGKLKLKSYYPALEDGNMKKAISFGKGEGIAGISVKDKRIVFVENTEKSNIYQHDKGDRAPRSLLCVPLLDGDIALGVMNFSGEVGEVHFEESDYEFASSIARSVTITIKNIRMREVIEEQNRTLEHKVEERTQALQIKTNDIISMMHNMHQGLFTIMSGGVVHHEYARYLEEIFETNEIANRNFMDLLFSSADLGGDQHHQIKTAIDAIIGEDEMMWEFNAHLLIHEFVFSIGAKEKIISLEWDPILLDDQVDKVMVTVRDVTNIKILEREAQDKKRELDIISQILSVDHEKFVDFVSTARAFLDENSSMIEQHSSKDLDVIALLFRNMHTIKGNARTYSLSYITDEVHTAENTYDALRKSEEEKWEQEKLRTELNAVRAIIDEYVDVCENVLGRNVQVSEDPLLSIAKSDLETIEASVNKLNDGGSVAKDEIQNVLSIIHSLNAVTFEQSIKDTCESLESIASQLCKPTPNIVFNGGDLLVRKESISLLNNVFSHLLRNSMDHGIELPEERLAKGKPEQGTISLNIHMEGELMNIEMIDDGKGLDILRLKEKGIETGVLSRDDDITNENVASLIFHSGMSTKQTVSSISGRGVGMDAVKKFIEQEGGSVTISLNGSGSNNENFQQFKTILKLPVGVK